MSEHPSIEAASSSSEGSPKKKFLIISILYALIAPGSIRAANVSYIPKLLTIRKVGIIPPEKTIVNITILRRGPLPTRFFLERP